MWNCEKCGNVKVKCGNDSVGMWELGLGISITKLGLLDSVLYSHIVISIFNSPIFIFFTIPHSPH
jgi:hypothetical protein